MAIRSDLITLLTANLASSNASVSSELPYLSGGETLHVKNMKTVYVDEEQINKIELYNTLDNNDVFQTETLVSAFLTVDAKNQPGDIDTIVNNIVSARTGITGQTLKECEASTEINNDMVTYQFDFRFITV